MGKFRVEMVLKSGRVPLIQGVEVDAHHSLDGRLSPALQDVLGKLRIIPIDTGLQVETNPPSNRSIRFGVGEVVYTPAGSEASWTSLFHVRTKPASIIFADNTEIQVLPDFM